MQQGRFKPDIKKNSIMLKMAKDWNKGLWRLLEPSPLQYFRKRSVKNHILAGFFFIVLSTPIPVSAFQNEVSLHLRWLLSLAVFGKQCCRGIDVTQEAVTLLESMKVWTPGMGCDRPGQLSSASTLPPENQSESVCSGKLRPEKVQLFCTERDAENYSGSSAPKSTWFVLINKLNTYEILPKTSSTEKWNIFSRTLMHHVNYHRCIHSIL